MFCKFTTHLTTLALANGLSINDEHQSGATKKLAEIASTDLGNLPEFKWETETPICHSWISFQDWSLFDICDDDAPGGKHLRGDQTIDELKQTAEENDYDGFTVFTDNSSWSEGVYFKKCNVHESKHLPSAMTHRPGHLSYLQMTHPCHTVEYSAC